MLSAVVGRTSGWLTQRETVSLLLPSLLFWGSAAVLTVRIIGWSQVRSWAKGLDSQQSVLLGLGAAIALVLFVVSLQYVMLPLTRMYEGYWGSAAPGRKLAELGRARQLRRWKRLRDIIDARDGHDSPRAYAFWRERFPPDDRRVLPTRLGNVFRAAEDYPADPRRYGMDAALFWPRLHPLLPEPLRLELAAARATVDLALVSATLSGVLAVLVLAVGSAADQGWPVQLLLAAGLAATAWLCYGWSVSAAARYGELVRSAFDISRRGLLVALGVALPGSLEEEQRIWQALGQWLYRGGVDEALEGVLRFKADPR